MFLRAGSQALKKQAQAARVPEDTRVYAVGDIHGQTDLLKALHRGILADAEDSSATRFVVVYLGDYVDRGTDSRGTLELLIERPLPGFEAVHLTGNHEDFLVQFLEDDAVIMPWLMNGGRETCLSYGVDPTEPGNGADWTRQVQEALRAAIPASHLAFLRRLKKSHVEGDYFFVHAGVRPDLPLESQCLSDLLWIREPFLSSDQDFGKIVVHGHTPTTDPEIRPNRIGLDTGACYGGALTAAVFQDDRRTFIQV